MTSQDWRATVPGASAAPPYTQEQAYESGRYWGKFDREAMRQHGAQALKFGRSVGYEMKGAEGDAFWAGYESAQPPTDPPPIL